MKKEELLVFKSAEELANKFACQLMSWMDNNSGKDYHLAISGGKTPDLLLSVLAAKYSESELWRNVHFWWVDERMVSPNHAESNFGVVQKLLFSRISIPEENIHRIKGENDPKNEALSYSKQIQEKLAFENGWPVFDLILLGMGDDGHTASIFPDQMELLESEQICAVATHPGSGQKRVTLTGKAINNAHKVCFLVTGENKAERISEICSNQEKAILLPASHILPANENLDWYVDEPATKSL
ncbi:MAG TPA: 6-phosphogluconolactonase [Prolixibacteraceae bacterium]|nr:6-phosphogluconolactonase [Prolixibacteraceae bacterium]